MSIPHDGGSDHLQNSVDRLSGDLKSGAQHLQTVGAGEVKNLIADVEDLVARIANLKDADVVRVRNKVEQALASAKQSVVNGADTVRRSARQAASSTDDYVRENPWQALGVAALVGITIGFLASRRSQ
jgi:ElaB/YqjD/DUF883 family membrane-anchored ribosome-binding protein